MQKITVYCLSEFFAYEQLNHEDMARISRLYQGDVAELGIERLRKTVDGKATNVSIYRLPVNDERSILFTTTHKIDNTPSLVVLEVVPSANLFQAKLLKSMNNAELAFIKTESVQGLPATITDEVQLSFQDVCRYFHHFVIVNPGQSIGQAIIEFLLTNPNKVDSLDWAKPYCNQYIPEPFIYHVFDNDFLFNFFHEKASQSDATKALADEMLLKAYLSNQTYAKSNDNDEEPNPALSFKEWIEANPNRVSRLNQFRVTLKDDVIAAATSKMEIRSFFQPENAENSVFYIKINQPSIRPDHQERSIEPILNEIVNNPAPAPVEPTSGNTTDEITPKKHQDLETESETQTSSDSLTDSSEASESAKDLSSSKKKSKSSLSASRDSVFNHPAKRQKIEPKPPSPRKPNQG